MWRLLMLSGLLSVCFACGSDTKSVEESDKEETERTETVFHDQIQTIDKAKQVEDLVMDRKQQLDDAIDESEDDQ